MALTDDVKVYPGAFVVDVYTEIICVDPDEDGDLDGYTAVISYNPPSGGTAIQWPTGTLVPITAVNKDGKTIVKALIIPVVPLIAPSGCLGRLAPHLARRRRKAERASGSGTLSGSLNPPPPSDNPGGQVLVVEVGATKPPKQFSIADPVIYYDIPVAT